MLLMVIGLAIFFAVHLVPTQPELRKGFIERHGATAYKIGFTLVSLIGLTLIVLGFVKLQMNPGKNVQLWDPPVFMRHITLALMLPAMILLVAAFIPSRIRTAARHPMLAAIKVWALAHLLANGDLGSLVLFGSFLAFAVYDRISVKRRGDSGEVGLRAGGPFNDVIVLALGIALYVVMLKWGHQYIIGVPVLP